MLITLNNCWISDNICMATLCVTTLRDWFFQLYYICLATFETFSFSFISFKSMEEASSGREVNLGKCEALLKLTTCYLFLQADAVLVGEDGRQHRIHTFLLVLKFPFFRNFLLAGISGKCASASKLQEILRKMPFFGKSDSILASVGSKRDAQHTNIWQRRPREIHFS